MKTTFILLVCLCLVGCYDRTSQGFPQKWWVTQKYVEIQSGNPPKYYIVVTTNQRDMDHAIEVDVETFCKANFMDEWNSQSDLKLDDVKGEREDNDKAT